MSHHLHFQLSAENYRRVFIKTLNDKHAYGGSRTGDWGWVADSTFFRSVEDFTYQQPYLSEVISTYHKGLGLLLAWTIVLSLICAWGISKLKWS